MIEIEINQFNLTRGCDYMKTIFERYKELQYDFDNSGIAYSDEYYDVLGIERE